MAVFNQFHMLVGVYHKHFIVFFKILIIQKISISQPAHLKHL